jgi:hypothetical protein
LLRTSYSVVKEPRAKVTLHGARFGDWAPLSVSRRAISFRSVSHGGKMTRHALRRSQSCTSARHVVAPAQAHAACADTPARTHSRCGATPRARSAPRDVDHLARLTALPRPRRNASALRREVQEMRGQCPRGPSAPQRRTRNPLFAMHLQCTPVITRRAARLSVYPFRDACR